VRPPQLAPISPPLPLLPPCVRAVLGRSSRRLLAFTVQRQWVAATRVLLAAVCADQEPVEAMAEVRAVGLERRCRGHSASLAGLAVLAAALARQPRLPPQ
jgi:hypothetical protein